MFYSKVFPDYEKNCFSNLPKLIKIFFGLEEKESLPFSFDDRDFFQKENLIFFFIDSFGWRFIERYSKHPFLTKILKKGQIIKAVSQFPSTTSVHATSIHTGLTVAEHGIYEWQYYEPEVDSIFLPFRFSLARQEDRELSIDPSKIFPFDSIYKQLRQVGVYSYIFTEKISDILLILQQYPEVSQRFYPTLLCLKQ